MVKWKQSEKVIFSEKKSNETIRGSLCSESNVGIVDSLEPFGGELCDLKS